MPTPIKWLLKAFDILIAVGMAAITVLVFLNVVLRYGFSSGISVAVELSRVILIWIIFLGAISGLARGVHLAVDTLIVHSPQKARFGCFLVSRGLMLWCCWLLAQGSWALTRIEWGNITPLTGLPVGLNYAAALFAAVMFAVIIFIELWHALHGILPRTWGGAASDEAKMDISPALTQEKTR